MTRFLILWLGLVACSPATTEAKPATKPTATNKAAPVKAAPVKAAPVKAAPATGAGAAWLNAHNERRAKHCAPPLEWSPAIAKVAQAWADQLKAKGCAFGHSNNNKLGENLAAGTIGALDPETTVGMWYDEIKLYKFPDGGFSLKTGHFTQVVWKSTTKVGCGHVQCNGNDIYVCNYDPPGNWERQYSKEVLPTSCAK